MDVENNETLSISSAKSPKSPSFGELPIEISLEILCLAGSQSQATYRALLLTSKVIYNLIRVECIPFLPIVISRKSQVEPFMTWIKASPHLARRLKHLWLIPDSSPTAFDDRTRIIFIIINCPNLVSLACGIRELVDWDILCTAIRKDPSAAPIHFDLQLPLSLKHVTVMDNAPRILHQEQGDIFSQIETLHVIGSRDTLVDFPPSALLQVPRYTNLVEASFSFPRGAYPNYDGFLSGMFLQSPKLAKIAFITRTKPGSDSRMTSSSIQRLLGSKFTLLFRPKRWTETKMWKENVVDRGCCWKLRQHESIQTRS